jgi:hypothetical protein
MARSVPVEILRVDVHLLGEERLDHTEVTSDASDVERRSEILGPAVDVSTKLREELNKIDVSLVRRNVKWGPSIAIAFVQQSFSKFAILALEQMEARLVVAFFSADPDAAKQFPLLAALLLLNLVLARRNLRFLGLSH